MTERWEKIERWALFGVVGLMIAVVLLFAIGLIAEASDEKRACDALARELKLKTQVNNGTCYVRFNDTWRKYER